VAVVGAALIFGAMAMWVRSGPVGLDAGILQALEAARSTRATEAVVAITTVGRGLVTAAIVVLVAVWLSVRGHRKEAAFLVVANLGSVILSLGLQDVFARPRPPLDVVTPITSPESFSFPSGHALSAMVLYTSLAMIAAGLGLPRLKRALIALALIVVPTMGFTRLYLGVHYPGDVVGGWALGASWVWLVYLGYLIRTQNVPAARNPNSLLLP
jgi:undecaprenyl-diphosphatase